MPWEKMMRDLEDAAPIGELPPVPPENVTTQQLFMMMMAQNARIAVLVKQVSVLAEAQKDMVETWRTAGNVLKFLKLTATFGVAVAALWGFVKAVFHSAPPGPGGG